MGKILGLAMLLAALIGGWSLHEHWAYEQRWEAIAAAPVEAMAELVAVKAVTRGWRRKRTVYHLQYRVAPAASLGWDDPAALGMEAVHLDVQVESLEAAQAAQAEGLRPVLQAADDPRQLLFADTFERYGRSRRPWGQVLVVHGVLGLGLGLPLALGIGWWRGWLRRRPWPG